MGLISWVKNKHNEHKFQKARVLFIDGNLEEAIKILNQILETHPFAPQLLLQIYHSQVEKDYTNSFDTNIANLYSIHNELKNDCIAFVNNISNEGKLLNAINYASNLYGVGLLELKDEFIKLSTNFVLNNKGFSNLGILSDNKTLLIDVSKKLFAKLKTEYSNGKSLNECLRLAFLIEPYFSDKYFFDLFCNIRFDSIASNNISEKSCDELEILFKEVETKYSLSPLIISNLFDKGLLLLKKLYFDKKYKESLLVSRRLLERYSEAKTIYIESAYQLYKNNYTDTSIIDSKLIFNSIGLSGYDFIIAIERFVPFASYKETYKSNVCDLLKKYRNANAIEKGIDLFMHTWIIVPEADYFTASISPKYEFYSKKIVTFIINSSNTFLQKDKEMDVFVKELLKLSDIEFIVSSLEILVCTHKELIDRYIDQILRWTEGHDAVKKIAIINRGLSVIDNQELIDNKAQCCNDYINSNHYDFDFISSECKSLIGKNALAEVMLAQLAINKARSAESIDEIESAIKEALNYRFHHNKTFDQRVYDQKLPEINHILLKLAEQFYTENNYSRSVSLLYLLKDNKLEWFEMYGKLKLTTIDNISDPLDALAHLYNIIIEGKGTKANVLDLLWSKVISIATTSVQNLQVEIIIDVYCQLLVILSKECSIANKSIIEDDIICRLNKCYLQRGKYFEKNGNCIEAIKDYTQILDDKHTYPDVISRIFICKLKMREQISLNDEFQIDELLKNSRDKQYQKDLAYRWCLYLIKNSQIERAEDINTRILGNDVEILTLCNEGKILYQERILSDLNYQLLKLNSKELKAEDAISLGKGLSKLLQTISAIVEIPQEVENELIMTIRCYAIEKYYEQSDFIQCHKGLKVRDSEYLSNPLALRNIAIMCLRAAETDQLNSSNYKECISIWSTAIYQQALFVQSLYYTSWDDSYVFSLYGALGKLEDSNNDLPYNVNYSDDLDNKTVLIKDVQKSLIARMEVALSNNSLYHDFFLSQIEAMDKLAEQELDEDCVLVSPHMLTLSSKYRKSVSNALTIEADAHYNNWEEILEIGNLFGISDGDFKSYSIAKQYLEDAIGSIGNKTRVNNAFIQTRIDFIKAFSRLFSTLVSSATTALNKRIAEGVDYGLIFSEFNKICKVLADDGLSFNFSNYINQSIVEKLNNKTLSLAKGSEVLISIYGYCKCNPHLKRNLSNIVELLIHTYITNGDAENLDVLDNLLSSSRDFDNNIVDALNGSSDTPEEIIIFLFATNETRFNTLRTRIEGKSSVIKLQFRKTSSKLMSARISIELNGIVEKVNNNTMKKNDALEKVYNIYKNNKSEERVCIILVKLIPICVHEYVIEDKYGKHKVINVLDDLKNNKSLTFRNHTSEISKAYNLLWNQLPYNVRQVLQDFDSSASLTSEGQALKKGLDYLKVLS